MKKYHTILIGIFAAGVLMTGIGAGVAFTEFSALTYGGKELIGETEMRTEVFDVEFEPAEERQFIGGWYDWEQTDVLTDVSVPENTVRFQVTYNEKQIVPHAYWAEDERTIYLHQRWIGEEDDMELIMEAKDIFLKNLKEGRLVSFDTKGMEEVTIWVNPANENDVRLVW